MINIDIIYQQLDEYEQQFQKNGCDNQSMDNYKRHCLMIGEHKRFFATIINLQLYKRPTTQFFFVQACCDFAQKTIYHRYLPDYFFHVFNNLIQEKNTQYEIWEYYIKLWRCIYNKNSGGITSYADMNTLGLSFIATISILKHQKDKKHILDNIINHPIYKKTISFYNNFTKQPNIDDINQINDICFKHIKNVRKTHNFDSDPWICFYNDYINSHEYKEFTAPYYQYMEQNNIDYNGKLIFCFHKDKNIGDIYHYVQTIINWSIVSKIPLIGVLTEFQAKWISVYFGDYIDHIIIRKTHIPHILQTLYPAPNRAICLQLVSQDNPPYYFPRTTKRHFNYYTHHELCGVDDDEGDPVPISAIPHYIKQSNKEKIESFACHPKKLFYFHPIVIQQIDFQEVILHYMNFGICWQKDYQQKAIHLLLIYHILINNIA